MKLHRNKRGGEGRVVDGSRRVKSTGGKKKGKKRGKKKNTRKNINRSIFDGYFSRQRKGRAAVSRNLSANRRSV